MKNLIEIQEVESKLIIRGVLDGETEEVSERD